MKTSCFCRFLPRAWQLIACFAMTVINSYAALISFTHSGVGSGIIGNRPFTNASFTITELADTASRVSFVGGFSISDISASIAIAGAGNYQFTRGTLTFVNNSHSVVGFSRGPSGADLFNGPTNAAFASWDMLTPIGPVTGSTRLLQWSIAPVMTDGGVLVFNSSTSAGSFQATIVPEPGASLFITCGLIGAMAVSRRRLPTK